MRVVIVDDESLARDELAYLLKRHDDVKVVGEAADGQQAIEQIRELNPDAIFLDIQMPGLNGLGLARQLNPTGKSPFLVFATAYDNYAVEAFELEAVDYILKPFSAERVDETVGRLRKLLAQSAVPVGVEVLKAALNRLTAETRKPTKRVAVAKEEQTLFLDPDQIIYIYREERDVWIVTYEDRYRCTYTLQEMEEKLHSYSFFRPHRGFLINLRHVGAITPWFNGAYQLIMKNKEQAAIPVSRNQVKALLHTLEL